MTAHVMNFFSVVFLLCVWQIGIIVCLPRVQNEKQFSRIEAHIRVREETHIVHDRPSNMISSASNKHDTISNEMRLACVHVFLSLPGCWVLCDFCELLFSGLALCAVLPNTPNVESCDARVSDPYIATSKVYMAVKNNSSTCSYEEQFLFSSVCTSCSCFVIPATSDHSLALGRIFLLVYFLSAHIMINLLFYTCVSLAESHHSHDDRPQ